MKTQIKNFQDPSQTETINYYLCKGRRQRSDEAWKVLHAIGHSMLRDKESSTPYKSQWQLPLLGLAAMCVAIATHLL